MNNYVKIKSLLILVTTGLLLIACGVVEEEPPSPPFISGTTKIEIYEPDSLSDTLTYPSGEFSWYELTDSDTVFLLGIFTSEPTGTSNSGVNTSNLIAYGISDGPGVNPTYIRLDSGDVAVDQLFEHNTTDGFTLDPFTSFSAGSHFWAIWGIKDGEINYSSQAVEFTLN